jgi:hypothetical protein
MGSKTLHFRKVSVSYLGGSNITQRSQKAYTKTGLVASQLSLLACSIRAYLFFVYSHFYTWLLMLQPCLYNEVFIKPSKDKEFRELLDN